jgi:flagellar biosynthesis protein FlhB
MAELRPFPPSPRRLALARASGLTAASPRVVGIAALVGTLVAIAVLGRAAATRVGAWIAEACNASDGHLAHSDAAAGQPGSSAPLFDVARIARNVLELALPILALAALAALVAHFAQTRAFWLPRRKLPGAPVVPRHHGTWAAFDLASVATMGAVAVAWLWITAPQLAALVHDPRAAGLALTSFAATLAIAWVTLSACDALLRRHQLATALAMTREEKREDDRLAAADPRWRAQRLSAMRVSVSAAVARAAIVIVGDDTAVAIAWDPTRQPVPLRTAIGRRARAMQLAALARRHRIAVHRDVDLARALVDSEGPVPDAHWQRLAEIVAALRTR